MRQISILTIHKDSFLKLMKKAKIKMTYICTSDNHTVYSYSDSGNRCEYILYDIKEIYENHLTSGKYFS